MNVWTFIFYSSWPFLEIDDEKLYKSRIERRLVASCGLDAFGWKENHKKWLFVCYCPATLLFSWSRKWQYNHEECSSFTFSMKPFILMRTSFALLVLSFLLISQTFQFDEKPSNFYFHKNSTKLWRENVDLPKKINFIPGVEYMTILSNVISYWKKTM